MKKNLFITSNSLLFAAIFALAMSTCDNGGGGTTGGTKPTLSGTVTISSSSNGIVYDDILTANVDNVDGKSGNPTFQWLFDNDNPITGASSQETYTIQKTDVGKRIKVKVTYSGSNGSVTSNSTGEVSYKNLVTTSGETLVVENHTTQPDNDFTKTGGNGNTGTNNIVGRIVIVYNTNSSSYLYPAEKVIIGNDNNYKKIVVNGVNKAIVTINVADFYDSITGSFNTMLNMALNAAYGKEVQ